MHPNDMDSSTNITPCDLSQYQPGLIFDAGGVCLFGKHENELSAWRAKKAWVEVLHDYFLLEPDRDYDITVISDLSTLTFCVSCSFTSACGRYAFWRLINHQAPEAETQLGGHIRESASQSLQQSEKNTWLLTPLGEASENNSEAAMLLRKILSIFK